MQERVDKDADDGYISSQCIVSLERPVSQPGKSIRLRRILPSHRGGLVVAFDHALVHGPILGTIDPTAQIDRFIEGKADALLLNLGNFRYVAQAANNVASMPGLIARLDWTTALGTASINPTEHFRSCLVAHPEDAARAAADAVITFLILGSGDPDFESKEIERVGSVARECEQLGMPLIVESLARGKNAHNPQDPEWLKLHSRVAAELGADVIKTEYTGNPATMREVIDACPIPILVLGGSRSGSDDDILHVTQEIVQSGAAGVFFGRNVFQSEDIAGLMQRLHAVLSGQPPR
jgi:DhnA family fructose-bisphosphate aldolase class Ia